MGALNYLINWKDQLLNKNNDNSTPFADENEYVNSPYFVSLGAGINQAPLIHAARELGMRVIAVDRNHLAPGFAQSHIQVQCGLDQPKKIIRAIQENVDTSLISGVGSRTFGNFHMNAARVGEALELSGLSLKQLKFFQNKIELKKKLKKAGIPAPRMFSWNNDEQKERLLNHRNPIIVRPAVGHGKKDIQVLNGEQDVLQFLEKSPSSSRDILVEELIRGREITVLGYVQKGIYQNVLLTDKIVSQTPPLFAEIMHRYPASISLEQREIITSYMQTIANVSEIQNAPMVAEFLIDDKDKNREKIYLVEVSPEVGGEYLAELMIPVAYGYNYFRDMVRLYTNSDEMESPRYAMGAPDKTILIRFIPQQTGILHDIDLPDQLRDHPGHLFSRILKQPGERTSIKSGNSDRLAVFALAGSLTDSDQLHEDVERISSLFNVQYR